MERKIQIVHFLNPAFGGFDGGEPTHMRPTSKEGPVGPGLAFEKMLDEDAEVLGTVFCGDAWFEEHGEEALNDLMERIWNFQPDLVLAGPPLGDGKHAQTCGRICQAVQERLKVPAVTGMAEGNPAVDAFRSKVYIVRTSPDPSGLGEALAGMVRLGLKLVRFEPMGGPDEEGFFGRPGRGCEIA